MSFVSCASGPRCLATSSKVFLWHTLEAGVGGQSRQAGRVLRRPSLLPHRLPCVRRQSRPGPQFLPLRPRRHWARLCANRRVLSVTLEICVARNYTGIGKLPDLYVPNRYYFGTLSPKFSVMSPVGHVTG